MRAVSTCARDLAAKKGARFVGTPRRRQLGELRVDEERHEQPANAAAVPGRRRAAREVEAVAVQLREQHGRARAEPHRGEEREPEIPALREGAELDPPSYAPQERDHQRVGGDGAERQVPGPRAGAAPGEAVEEAHALQRVEVQLVAPPRRRPRVILGGQLRHVRQVGRDLARGREPLAQGHGASSAAHVVLPPRRRMRPLARAGAMRSGQTRPRDPLGLGCLGMPSVLRAASLRSSPSRDGAGPPERVKAGQGLTGSARAPGAVPDGVRDSFTPSVAATKFPAGLWQCRH